MDPDDYNRAEIVAGRLTMAHITALVRHFQASRGFNGDSGPHALDGKAGRGTREALDELLAAPPAPVAQLRLASPLPILADGRSAQITNAFRTPARPDHVGVDLFYPWRPGDRPDFVGDKGGATKLPDGKPRWVVPYNTHALAAADGVVQIAGNSRTGFRCWIDHENGFRTGYFHLLDLRVAIGERVRAGTPLGLVGDNPADHDGRHLHFELSPCDRYAPLDPAPYLRG